MSDASLFSATQAVIFPFRVLIHFLNSVSENIQLSTKVSEDLNDSDTETCGFVPLPHSSHKAEMSDPRNKSAPMSSLSQSSADTDNSDMFHSALSQPDTSNNEYKRCTDCGTTLPRCHFHLLSLVSLSSMPASNCIGCRFYRLASARLEDKGDDYYKPAAEDIVNSVLDELEETVSRFFEEHEGVFPASERARVWRRIADHSRLAGCVKGRPLFDEAMREHNAKAARVRHLADRMESALSSIGSNGWASEIPEYEINLLNFITKQWEHRAGIEKEVETNEETDSFHSANENTLS